MGRQAAETLLSGEAHQLIPYQQRFLETYAPHLSHHMVSPTTHEADVRQTYDHFKASLSSSSSLTSDMTHFNDRKDKEGFGSTFEKTLHDKKDTLASHVSQKEDDTQNYIADHKESHRKHAKETIPMEKLGGDVIPDHEQYPYLHSRSLKPSAAPVPHHPVLIISGGETLQTSPMETLVSVTPVSEVSVSATQASDLTLPHTNADLRQSLRRDIEQALENAGEKAHPPLDPKFLGLKKN